MKWLILPLLGVVGPMAAHGFGAGPKLESDAYGVDGAQISDCVARAAAPLTPDFVNNAASACGGLGLEICTIDDAPVVFDRVSALTCLSLEREHWEWRLDAAAGRLSGNLAPAAYAEDLRGTTAELDAMIGMWRAFAATKCSYFTSEYGIGPGRGREGDITEHACVNNETARFALELEFRLRTQCQTQRAAVYGTACEFSE